MQDFREIISAELPFTWKGGCWTWQRDVSTLSFHNIWPLQHQRLYGEDPSWIWQFILSFLQQKRGSFSSGAWETWATQSFCWFVVNVQGFVRNCEFRENLCRWQCMPHAGGGFVGGEGVLHQKNKKNPAFSSVFLFTCIHFVFWWLIMTLAALMWEERRSWGSVSENQAVNACRSRLCVG